MSGVKLRSGVLIDPFDPKPHQCWLEDIANHHARMPRWGAHTTEDVSLVAHTFSVADVAVHRARSAGTDSTICLDAVSLLGHVHDCGEVVFGDPNRPVKKRMVLQVPNGGITTMDKAEMRLLTAYLAAYGVDANTLPGWEHVWAADDLVLRAEAEEWLPGGVSDWEAPPARCDVAKRAVRQRADWFTRFPPAYYWLDAVRSEIAMVHARLPTACTPRSERVLALFGADGRTAVCMKMLSLTSGETSWLLYGVPPVGPHCSVFGSGYTTAEKVARAALKYLDTPIEP